MACGRVVLLTKAVYGVMIENMINWLVARPVCINSIACLILITLSH